MVEQLVFSWRSVWQILRSEWQEEIGSISISKEISAETISVH